MLGTYERLPLGPIWRVGGRSKKAKVELIMNALSGILIAVMELITTTVQSYEIPPTLQGNPTSLNPTTRLPFAGETLFWATPKQDITRCRAKSPTTTNHGQQQVNQNPTPKPQTRKIKNRSQTKVQKICCSGLKWFHCKPPRA